VAFEKFRAFMDLGRVQGVSVTAAVAILGSLTAETGPGLDDLFWLVVISIFAHIGGAALNELWDRKLDSAVRELARKPLVSGALAPREAKVLIAFSVPLSLVLALLVFGVPAFIAMLIATVWMQWYCTSGKRTFIVSDFAQCVGYPAYALFGALAASRPTVLTWPLLGIVATLNLFAQWGNGLKDADNDRRFGIPSFAARSGVSSGKGLAAGHPYFIYGVAVKAAFLLFCTLPIFMTRVPMAYIFVVLALGYPVQYMTMREFLGMKTRNQYVRLILGDLLSSYPAAAAMSILSAGLTGFLLLAVFVFGGYLAGSALQSGAEFKFRRGAGPARRKAPAGRDGRLYIKGNPILMTWIAKVTHR
jgi:4-hydroxybenzoate polyprenyltransferase